MGRFLVWKIQGDEAELHLHWRDRLTPTGIRKKVARKPTRDAAVMDDLLLALSAALGGIVFGEVVWAIRGGWNAFAFGPGGGAIYGGAFGSILGTMTAWFILWLLSKAGGVHLGRWLRMAVGSVAGGLVGSAALTLGPGRHVGEGFFIGG